MSGPMTGAPRRTAFVDMPRRHRESPDLSEGGLRMWNGSRIRRMVSGRTACRGGVG